MWTVDLSNNCMCLFSFSRERESFHIYCFHTVWIYDEKYTTDVFFLHQQQKHRQETFVFQNEIEKIREQWKPVVFFRVCRRMSLRKMNEVNRLSVAMIRSFLLLYFNFKCNVMIININEWKRRQQYAHRQTLLKETFMHSYDDKQINYELQ